MDDILNAWRARQSSTPTFQINWTAEVTSLLPDLEKTFAYSQTRMLAFDGVKTRHELRGPKLVDTILVDSPYVHIFDGVHNSFHHGATPSVSQGQSPSTGFVDDMGFAEKGNPHIEPIIFHYRILEPALSDMREAGWSISDSNALLDGRPCVVVRQSIGHGRTLVHWDFWLAPESRYVVRRYSARLSDGRVLRECDILHDDESGGHHSLTGWRSMLYFAGNVSESVTATVYSTTVSQVIDQHLFSYDFPVDTVVNEHLEGEQKLSYIVRPGGKRRIVTREEMERGATYAQLLATASGEAAKPVLRSRYVPVFLIVGALVLVMPFLVFKWFLSRGGQR